MNINVKIKKESESFATDTVIDNGLKSMQSIVKGFIEPIELTHNIYMIINEEGKIQDLPANLILADDIIVGPIIFCSCSNGDFVSLSYSQKEEVDRFIKETSLE